MNPSSLRLLAVCAPFAFALTAFGIAGCSSADAETEEEENAEGALSADSILGALIGEASRGRTLPRDFQTRTAQEKQSIAWAKATEAGQLRCKLDPSRLAGDTLVNALQRCKVGRSEDDLMDPNLFGTVKAATWSAFVALLDGANLLSPAFEPNGDETQTGRKKVIHSFGSVGKIELRINATSEFTGVLAPPKAGETFTRVPGLARFSSGGPEKLLGFLPGAGVKLFTTAGQSVDIHLLPPKPADGSPEAEAEKARPNHNVFAHPFSNEFAKAGEPGKVEKIFAKVHPAPLFLPIDHMGRRTVDGEVVQSPKAPKQLSFVPDRGVQAAAEAYLQAHPAADYRIALAEATKNASEENPVTLYTVRVGLVGAKQPTDLDREYPAIGTFVATSPLVPSKWADRQLYTRHNRGCTPVEPDARIPHEGAVTTAEAPSLCSGGN